MHNEGIERERSKGKVAVAYMHLIVVEISYLG